MNLPSCKLFVNVNGWRWSSVAFLQEKERMLSFYLSMNDEGRSAEPWKCLTCSQDIDPDTHKRNVLKYKVCVCSRFHFMKSLFRQKHPVFPRWHNVAMMPLGLYHCFQQYIP